jgi:hypothetical protein
MKNMMFGSIVLLLFALLIFCPFSPIRFETAAAQDKKLTVEELISRHLESIGNAEARSKVTSRVASGSVTLNLRVGGAGNLKGTAMMVTENPKLRFGMQFSTVDYTGEDMAFDGNKTSTGFLPQGRRSGLSAFLNSQNLPLRDGLIGGALSTAWPLLRMDQSQPKLDYRGLKKVDGRQLHEVGYRPRRGSTDLKVLLWFEPETFRHVRTRYSYEVGATIGTREAPNQNTESYYSLTEEFSDFRTVDGLMLPHQYKLQLSIQGNSPGSVTSAGPDFQGSRGGPPSALYDWAFTVTGISHKEKFDAQIFKIN